MKMGHWITKLRLYFGRGQMRRREHAKIVGETKQGQVNRQFLPDIYNK